MSRTVVSPERIRWRVGRQWLPWRVRLQRPDWREWGGSDFSGADLFDAPAGVLAGLAVIATAMVLLLVVFPIVAIAIEAVVLVLVLLSATTARVLLRRPWTVRAVSAGETQRVVEWRVVGWRASGAMVAEAADALEHGRPLPAGANVSGPEPRPLTSR